MFVYSPHSPFFILVICFPPYFCILWFVSRWSTLERGNVCLQYTLSVLYLGYLFFSPPYLCILWFVSKWSTLERGNVCLQSTLSVLYLGYLFSPIFLHPMIYIQVVHLRVDHLDTNHRMQRYGGEKTDNQDTKRRVCTVNKHYHVLR
jgi:hypothetical protein